MNKEIKFTFLDVEYTKESFIKMVRSIAEPYEPELEQYDRSKNSEECLEIIYDNFQWLNKYVFRKYDLDTGFKPEDDENPFII